MPNVYRLLKPLQQNSVICILVEVIKPLWNSHRKVLISLNICPFVWYDFDSTLRISLAFISEATGVTVVTTQPTHHTIVGYLIDFLRDSTTVQIIFFLPHNESYPSNVLNSENNSSLVYRDVPIDIPFISPSILSVSLYFNLIYFWLLGLW